MSRNRRAFLAATVGVAGILAGCSGGNGGTTTADATETDTPTETATATPEPLMMGEEAYEDARLTDEDVQSIRFREFDHNIPGVERLVESSYEEENLKWRVQGARTREEALQKIFEFASGTIDYRGNNMGEDDADAIAVARELAHHADEYSDYSFEYEDTMIDQHTIYAGEVGQDGSVLFKDEDGEWNHHYADPFKSEWRGPAVETDYFSEDPSYTASTQSPRGFWAALNSLGAFDGPDSEMDWEGHSRDLNNFRYGKHDYSTDSDVQVYFDGDTYHNTIPEMYDEDVSGIVDMMRYINQIASETYSGGLRFSHEDGSWTHEEVYDISSHFQDMMEYRTN